MLDLSASCARSCCPPRIRLVVGSRSPPTLAVPPLPQRWQRAFRWAPPTSEFPFPDVREAASTASLVHRDG